jgi:hypothetical protein
VDRGGRGGGFDFSEAVNMRQTHTFVTLDLSEATFNEIKERFEEVGYDQAFLDDGLIDMNGIAVRQSE